MIFLFCRWRDFSPRADHFSSNFGLFAANHDKFFAFHLPQKRVFATSNFSFCCSSHRYSTRPNCRSTPNYPTKTKTCVPLSLFVALRLFSRADSRSGVHITIVFPKWQKMNGFSTIWRKLNGFGFGEYPLDLLPAQSDFQGKNFSWKNFHPFSGLDGGICTKRWNFAPFLYAL